MEEVLVVCDLETTGLNPSHDEIVEIGLVKIIGNRITDTFHSLVKHSKPLPLRISNLTGLGEIDFEDAPNLDHVLPKAINFIGDSPIIGHNIKFDMGFINANLSYDLPNVLLDTWELARLIYPTLGSYRLGKVCDELDIELISAHRALGDATATAELYLKLMRELNGFDLRLLLQLASLIKISDTNWKNHILKVVQDKARKFSDEKISGGPYIGEHDETDGDELSGHNLSVGNILGRSGVLSRKFNNYEYRPQQIEASLAIESAFADKKHLLVEAGTGVGKSFAYLIPAILWALGSKERVVISTHTINLQEQLYKKDIPHLRDILDIPFKASLLKGRKNYLCLRRWQAAIISDALRPQEAFFMARLLLWRKDTVAGDRMEINLLPEENEFWERVCADSENCMGSRCSWFYNGCYLSMARKKAEKSNIIVVNHSLLFSNLSTDNRILPPYRSLVIDEAHHLEDAATDYLGKEVSSSSFLRLISSVERYLVRLSRVLVSLNPSEWAKIIQNCRDIATLTKEACTNYFMQITQFVNNYSSTRSPKLKWRTIRLNATIHFTTDDWHAIESEKHNLFLRLQKLIDSINILLEQMQEWTERTGKGEELLEELNSFSRIALQYFNDLKFITERNEDYVTWAGTKPKGSKTWFCYLRAAPIDVSELLFERLFQTHDSIILTSATMTVNSSFDFFAERTGIRKIDANKYRTLKVGSPFALEKQVLLCLARDIPLPGPLGSDVYHTALSDAITMIADVIGGRTMVLFTSHNTLQKVYHQSTPGLAKRNIMLLGQGLDGSRNALIREFKASSRAVLFGAASFWEGVDLPGNLLKCVIIARLPFQAPSIPVVEARLERLTSMGSDAFSKLSLPHAVLKFKQGFGRLIRSKADSGVVVVLDSRLLEKRYGSNFIRSLGINRFYSGSMDKIALQVDNWVNNDH